MWKDYFSFNKRQRNGIVVLLATIVIMITWLFISDNLPPKLGNINSLAVTSDKQPDASNEQSSIELNSANESTLEENSKLAPYANAILAYRNKLGGFVSKEQLKEVRNMDSAQYNLISNYVRIDDAKVHKFDLNTCTVKEIAHHPYIGYFISQAIVNYREQHGNYKTVNDLLKSAAIDKTTFAKISPYFTVKG